MTTLSGISKQLFFLLSASLFPLALSSYGDVGVFKYLSSPLFSIVSGFLFHQMVARHQLISENNIKLNSKYNLILLIYYCSLYATGIAWSTLFINNQTEEVQMDAQTFIFLPIVNSLLFSFIFAIRYLFLKLQKYESNITRPHPSGLSNFKLKSQDEYSSLLQQTQTVDKRIVSIEQEEGGDSARSRQNKEGIQAVDSKEKTMLMNQSEKKSLPSQLSSMNNFRVVSLESESQPSEINEKKQEIEIQSVRFLKVLFGIQVIFIVIILQIIFGVNITKVFDFMLSKSPYFIYVVCLGYPILIGIIKSVNVLVNSKLELNYEWQLQFLSLFFAGLPYRGLYLTFYQFELGFVIIIIKFFYKCLVYYVQFRLANSIFNAKFKLTEKIQQIKDEKSKKTLSKLPSLEGKKDQEKQTDKQPNRELEKAKQKSQSHQELVYKFEIIQFSDLLHLCGVFFALLLSMSVSNSSLPVQQSFRDNLTSILILFLIELVSEIIFSFFIANKIGKVEHFFGFSFVQFLKDIDNFSSKNFGFLFSSLLCAYSILFIVFNN